MDPNGSDLFFFNRKNFETTSRFGSPITSNRANVDWEWQVTHYMGGGITRNQVVFHVIQPPPTAQPRHNGTAPDLYYRNCTTADAGLCGESPQTVIITHLGWTNGSS